VLLILTDGAITDSQKTIDAIVQASFLPLSIIIIGVGNADFSQMNILDGDGMALRSSNGQIAARDIVQFVPFRDFASRGIAELAAEVLRELPNQITDFFSRVGKAPNQPIVVSPTQYTQMISGVQGMFQTAQQPPAPQMMAPQQPPPP
jgi:hypothetical protein